MSYLEFLICSIASETGHLREHRTLQNLRDQDAEECIWKLMLKQKCLLRQDTNNHRLEMLSTLCIARRERSWYTSSPHFSSRTELSRNECRDTRKNVLERGQNFLLSLVSELSKRQQLVLGSFDPSRIAMAERPSSCKARSNSPCITEQDGRYATRSLKG